MDTNQWFVAIGVIVASCAATWLGTRWWYGRKLVVSLARIRKLEKAREVSFQQTTQARKQLEQLQREMAELRRPPGQREVAKPNTQAPEEPHRATDNPLLRPDSVDEPAAPHHGFAETQVIFPQTRMMEPGKKGPH